MPYPLGVEWWVSLEEQQAVLGGLPCGGGHTVRLFVDRWWEAYGVREYGVREEPSREAGRWEHPGGAWPGGQRLAGGWRAWREGVLVEDVLVLGWI